MPRRRGLSNTARALLMVVHRPVFPLEPGLPPSRFQVTVKSVGVIARPRQRRLSARSKIDGSADTARRGDAYVLSASLVRLDARESRDGARASCVVSATLRQARTGTLLAMMRGSGTAEDDRNMLEGAKERALEAAVYGAVRRLPEAL